MRKQYLRSLIVLIGVAGLAMAARGQAVDQIVVNIPYEFVAAGKTLPAGTYRVNRVGLTDPALILSSLENGSSVLVLPTQVESTNDDKAQVSFEQVGGQHFLSKIETADHVIHHSQCPVRKSWKPQRDHTAARLAREVRLEATRSAIHAGAACGSPLCI